jgi:hypothetical protein
MVVAGGLPLCSSATGASASGHREEACPRRLRLGPLRGGRPSPPPPRATAWRSPLAAFASSNREEAALIRAEQWSRGEAAVAEEQWKEWRSRGVAVVAGAAPRGAGRVVGSGGAEEQGEGRCVCFCSFPVGDIPIQ